MANSIEFFRGDAPTITAAYPLDVDTGLDARGICWGGQYDGSLFFWIVLASGATGAAVLKRYKVNIAKANAVQLGSFRIAKTTDTFYGITTDGANLYILKNEITIAPDTRTLINVHKCNNPATLVQSFVVINSPATPGDITFDGTKLWWNYSLNGDLETPPFIDSVATANLGKGGFNTVQVALDARSIEHTGDNTFLYVTTDTGGNVGLCYKKDAETIKERAISGSALTNHYKLCRFGRDDYAITGA